MTNNAKKGYELATLDNGQLWVRTTPTGQVRLAKARMTLSESAKELCVIENTPMITAEGFYSMNRVASLTIITPDSISVPDVDGQVRKVANPFPIIDPASGTQRGVWTKKMAVGRGPTGNMVVSSTTMFYDFTVYFLADLQRKIKGNKNAGRLCFADQVTEDEKKRGIFMRIDGELGIYADTNNADVLKCVSTWLQNKQFGERKAQTIAERNAFKHHPALSVKLENLRGAKDNMAADVTVIGWQHDFEYSELAEIARAVEAGEDTVINGEKVEVHETTTTAEFEDVQASTEADPEMTPPLESEEEGSLGLPKGELF